MGTEILVCDRTQFYHFLLYGGGVIDDYTQLSLKKIAKIFTFFQLITEKNIEIFNGYRRNFSDFLQKVRVGGGGKEILVCDFTFDPPRSIQSLSFSDET